MKRVFYLLAVVLMVGTGSIIISSKATASSEIRVRNLSRENNNSDYSYVKPITCQSRMGTIETYKLYRDADDNFCVKRQYGEGYASLEIYNSDGWSHKFSDGTTWYCNVY